MFWLRWVSNFDYFSQKKNLKIIEPDEDLFSGNDLARVEKDPKYIKLTLKTMGIKKRAHQDYVIQKIKELVAENIPDVW